MKKISATVLHERQVEETTEALGKGQEGFYRSSLN